ncbi:MAG: succinyl-diaminopimelate desuccinylase [Acidimicrobiia bacterium]
MSRSLIEDLQRLVDIPSATGEEDRLCSYLQERLLSRWGSEAVQRFGNSLVVGSSSGRGLVVLYGHLDTVPQQAEPGSRIDGDRLYGLGASDMKAGIAVMVHLLEDSAVRQGRYDVVGVFYDREEGPAQENGLENVLDAVDWLASAEFAVVLEPTDLELQLGCQGFINATVTFTGRSAHSARPWLGENAVTKAGEWLAAMHLRRPEPVAVAGLEYLELFTVTRAAGGVARNIVPPRFDVNLNYRFPPTLTVEEAEARLRETTVAADKVTIVDGAAGAPVPEGNPHLERLQAVSGSPRAPKQAWTDVARLAQRGVAAVNYGPGEVAQAHQADESVPVANLEAAFDTLKAFLTS